MDWAWHHLNQVDLTCRLDKNSRTSDKKIEFLEIKLTSFQETWKFLTKTMAEETPSSKLKLRDLISVLLKKIDISSEEKPSRKTNGLKSTETRSSSKRKCSVRITC